MANVLPFKDAWRRARDSMQNLVTGFGTSQDKQTATTYLNKTISEGQLTAAYRGDWIARKVIDIPAEDATRAWREWQAEDDQITDIEDTERRLQVKQRMRECLVKARLYGGAVIIMGFGDGNQEKELDPTTVKKDGLKFLHVMSKGEITVGQMNRDPLSEFYGQPEYYQLNSLGQGMVTIHPSRVVRLIGNPAPRLDLSDNGWGDSVLLAIDDAIKNAGITCSALANLIQEAKTDVVKIPNLMANLATDEYETQLIERFQLAGVAKSVVNTLILDKEEEWARTSTQFTALPDAVRMYLMIASGAADIPATRMLGQSPAGMNATGESDIRNYYDMVASQQENVLRPALNILDKVIKATAGIADPDDEIWYEWTSLWQQDDDQKARTVLTKAQAFAIHKDSGMIDPEILAEGLVNQLIEDGVYPGLNLSAAQAPEVQDPMVPIDPATGQPLQLPQSQAFPDPAQKRLPPPSKEKQQVDAHFKEHVRDRLLAWATDSNECHNPAGDPSGGQFCAGPKDPFATDFGREHDVTDPEGKVIMTLPRFGVWKYDPARGKHQVAETGNDLADLIKRHGIHPSRVHRVKDEANDCGEDCQCKECRSERARPFGDETDSNECHNPAGSPDGGQFCSDPDTAAASERLGLSDKYTGTDAPDRFRKLIVDSPLQKSTTVSYADATGEGAISVLKSPGETRTVSIGSLRGAQDYVFPQRLEHYTTNDPSAFRSTGNPIVVSVGGEDVILDGHHRVAAAKLSGATDIQIDHKGTWTVSHGVWSKATADSNECHEPAGSEKGGEFCSEGMSAEEHERVLNLPHEKYLEWLRKQAKAVMEDMGLNPADIEIVDGKGPPFKLNGQNYTTAGLAFTNTGKIQIFSGNVNARNAVGVMIHEAMHQRFENLVRVYGREQQQVKSEMISPDGLLREEYKKQFPVYAAYQHAAGGSRRAKLLQKEDGVSQYSKDWWKSYNNGEASLHNTVHETIAEMARLHKETGVLPGGRNFRRIYRLAKRIKQVPIV